MCRMQAVYNLILSLFSITFSFVHGSTKFVRLDNVVVGYHNRLRKDCQRLLVEVTVLQVTAIDYITPLSHIYCLHLPTHNDINSQHPILPQYLFVLQKTTDLSPSVLNPRNLDNLVTESNKTDSVSCPYVNYKKENKL